jgi:glycosyltransferase involved in cell wall biosynthesis
VTASQLWLASHLDVPSGHADEVVAFLRALEAHGRAPAARELSTGKVPSVELRPGDRAMLDRQLAREPSPPFVAVHAYVPRRGRGPLPGVANVARVMFETDRLPDGWVGLLDRHDEVWVPSDHNRAVFAETGVPESKLHVIGGTLDFDAFSPRAEPHPIERRDGEFVFLSSFDFSDRKGWRPLLEAWTRTFHPHDPVRLVLKTGSVAVFSDSAVKARIDSFLGGLRAAPVDVLVGMLPAARVPGLYAMADAFVSASRGEGWGRTYMEALAMGLPTIGTRWGGHLEFMSDEESWLADGELVPIPEDSELVRSFYSGHRWFDVDVDDLARLMREVAADPAAARRKARPARQRLLARFGPEATVARLDERVRAVLAARGAREAVA